MRRRTAGHLEMALAAAETSPVRIRSLTSSPPSIVRCAPSRYATRTSASPQCAETVCSSCGSILFRSMYSATGAIHRARVQMQNMKPLRHLIGDRGFPRAHRAVDGNVHRHISFPPVWLLVQPSFFYYTLQARFCSSPRPDLGVILHFIHISTVSNLHAPLFCLKSTFFRPFTPFE